MKMKPAEQFGSSCLGIILVLKLIVKRTGLEDNECLQRVSNESHAAVSCVGEGTVETSVGLDGLAGRAAR